MHTPEPEPVSPPPAPDSPLPWLPNRWWRRLLAACFCAAFILGAIGHLQVQEREQTGLALGSALYQTAQLFVLNMGRVEGQVPLALEAARWLAVITFFGTLLRVGARIFSQERAERRLRKVSGHVILCGLGRKGMALAAHLRGPHCPGGKQTVVVLEKSPAPDLVARCEQLGVPVLTGDATQPGALARAGLARAASLFAVCSDDATNCAIAAQVMKSREAGAGSRLVCHVHLSDADLRQALQHAPASHAGQTKVHLRFFDVFDPEARRLVAEGLPLDHDGLPPGDPRAPHLVILGFGQMGRTLALRAAQLGIFANGKRLRLSVIDRRADAHRDELLFRHPQIAQVADLEFHQQEVASPKTRVFLEACCADAASVTSVAICFDNDALALELALELLPVIEGGGARLAVRLSGEQGLAQVLARAQADISRAKRIVVFGMEELWCRAADPDGLGGDVFARGIHAEYERLTNPSPPERAGLPAPQPLRLEVEPWFKQPEDFRESCRQQAAHLHIKLRAIGCEVVSATNDPRPAVMEFPPEELELLSRLEHDRWMAERLIANWRFAPGQKDIARRTNPHLVPWAHLGADIQKYDREFVRLIPRLLGGMGLKVCRRDRRG